MMLRLRHFVIFFILLTQLGTAQQAYAAKKLYRSVNTLSGLSATDISDLITELGPKTIRYSITLGLYADTATREQYFAALNSILDNFDNNIVPILQAHNVQVVLSVANPPGGFSSRNLASPKMRIFDESWAQDAMKDLWTMLSQRYAASSTILAYHLCNEPAIGNGPAAGLLDWYKLQLALITLIRVNDKTHTISVDANYSSPNSLNKIKIPKGEKNVWYSFNAYYPTKFVNQGLTNDPKNPAAYSVSFPSNQANKSKITGDKKHPSTGLYKAIQFGKLKKKTLFVTEFATTLYAPGSSSSAFLDQIIKIFEQYHWNWAFHAWREAEPWDVEKPAPEDTAGQETQRAKVLKTYFSK